MTRKIVFLAVWILMLLSISKSAFAERDWEYWSRYSFELPLNQKVSYLVKPEWRIKDDMTESDRVLSF